MQKSQICAHATAFHFHLIELLDRKTSPLGKSIARGNWHHGKPDHERYHQSQGDLTLRKISRLAERLTRTSPSKDDDALPPLEVEPEKRIAWNFCYDDDPDLIVEPFVQQREKRGKGFTKGRKLSLKHVKETRGLPTNDIDAKVISCITKKSDYYYYDENYVLSAPQALEMLVGQPSVSLNGEPAIIEAGDVDIELMPRKDGNYIFLTRHQWADEKATALTHRSTESSTFAEKGFVS